MIDRRLRQLFLFGFCACIFLCSARSVSANDVLRYRVTCSSETGEVQSYTKFSQATREIQPGDVIEYDVYLNNVVPGLGGLDIKNADGTYWRNAPDWQDQNGLSGNPTADISSKADRRWYHRSLSVPPSVIGKTIEYWDVAVDGTYSPDYTVSAQYDNIVITNNGQEVLTVHRSGPTPYNVADISVNVARANLIWGPVRRPGTQVGTHLFYWYDAPYNNAPYSAMAYHPYGLAGDSYPGYGGGYYSSCNEYWWEGVFQDMKRAGIDIAAPVCWGDHPWPWFQISVMAQYMVPALERSGCGIKIAMFDDTTSTTSQWNLENGRGYSTTPKMPLSDQTTWIYFYDKKIKPFFEGIPKEHWATHNGLSMDEGGRPLIIAYSAGYFADVSTHGSAVWQWVKDRFAADFKDSSEKGLFPWLVLSTSWPIDPSVVGGAYGWGAALNGPTTRDTNGYTVTEIGPGFDERLIKTDGRLKERLDGAQLIRWFNSDPRATYQPIYKSNLIMMETWNEFWEATGIDRCKDYPADAGGYLSDTHYMDIWRNLIASSVGLRELDATFLRIWNIPDKLVRGQSVDVLFRNDGFLPWDPGEYRLAAHLIDPVTQEVVPGSARILAEMPQPVLSGDECTISFTVPTDWPDGDFILRLDMMRGPVWFAEQGDSPVKRQVHISAPDCSIDMGITDVNNLLSRVPNSDGDTIATIVGGLECRRPIDTGDRYFYFAVDDSFIYNTDVTVYLEVCYFDDRSTSTFLRPEYDSAYSTDPIGTGGRHYRANSVYFTNSGKWKTATWVLTRAKFANRQSNGADFRIYVGTTGLVKIDSVRISKVPWTAHGGVERDLGQVESYQGLSHPQALDGNTVAAIIEGRGCRRPASSGHSYFYFNASDAIIYDGSPSTVYLRVDYFDSPGGFIQPQYDYMSGAYTPAETVTFTGTNTWRSATWTLTNCRFANSQAESSDFRLYVGEGGNVHIDRVVLSKAPLVDTILPSVPQDVQAVAVSETAIHVTWSAATDNIGVVAYKVYRNGENVANAEGQELVDSGLEPATTYSYTVSSVNWADAESAQSSPPAVAATFVPVLPYKSDNPIFFELNGSTLATDPCSGVWENLPYILAANHPHNTVRITRGITEVPDSDSYYLHTVGGGYLSIRSGGGNEGRSLSSCQQGAANNAFGIDLWEWDKGIVYETHCNAIGSSNAEDAGRNHTIGGIMYNFHGLNGNPPGAPPGSSGSGAVVCWLTGEPDTSADDTIGLYDIQTNEPILVSQYSLGTGSNITRTFRLEARRSPLPWDQRNDVVLVSVYVGEQGVRGGPLTVVPGLKNRTVHLPSNPDPDYGNSILLGTNENASESKPRGDRFDYLKLYQPDAAVDNDPPTVPSNAEVTPAAQSVEIRWNASSDPTTEVIGYRIKKNGSYIAHVEWDQTQYTDVDGTLADSYQITAVDAVGNESQEADASVNIGALKLVPDFSPVTLTSKIVTAVFDGYLYVEEEDRSSGIRIVPLEMPVGLEVGELVDVNGLIQTENERMIVGVVHG